MLNALFRSKNKRQFELISQGLICLERLIDCLLNDHNKVT